MFLTRATIIDYTRKNILTLLNQLQDTGVYIDIGCEEPDSTPSMTADMVKKSKLTLLFEPRTEYYNQTKQYYSNYPNVRVDSNFITPKNILEKIIIPLDNLKNSVFLLDVDIDGYDFYLTESILKKNIKPVLLSLEINEKIPPPIKFSVLYNELYKFPDAHFYGASISKIEELKIYGYDLIQLFFNSIILIRTDINPYYTDNELYRNFKPRTAEELYKKQYVENRLYEKIEYNQDVNFWLTIQNTQTLISTINDKFKSHLNEYEIYL